MWSLLFFRENEALLLFLKHTYYKKNNYVYAKNMCRMMI